MTPGKPKMRFCSAGRDFLPTRTDIVCFWDVLISIFTASELFVGRWVGTFRRVWRGKRPHPPTHKHLSYFAHRNFMLIFKFFFAMSGV